MLSVRGRNFILDSIIPQQRKSFYAGLVLREVSKKPTLKFLIQGVEAGYEQASLCRSEAGSEIMEGMNGLNKS